MIRYEHGKKLDGFFCDKCGAHTGGRVLRELFRWIVKADCGHILQRGYVLPPKELERRGYINQEQERDPRAIATEQTLREDARRQWREQTHYHISKSDHCLINGEVYTNPLKGISERELDKQPIQVVLELLEAIYDYQRLQSMHNNLQGSKENISVSRDIAPHIKRPYNQGDG